MKNVEEMTDREILVELLAEKRKNDILRYVRYFVYAVLCAVVVYFYLKFAREFKEIVDSFHQIQSQVDSFQEQFNNISGSFEEISSSFDPEAIKEIQQLAEKLQSILSRFGL